MVKQLTLVSLAALVLVSCQDAADPTALGLADATSPQGETQGDAKTTTQGTASAAEDDALSGTGTATIDGMIAAGEWDAAAEVEVFSGDYAGSTLHVMNDGSNLYMALVVPDATPGDDDRMVVRFDNANNDVTDDGDDKLLAALASFEDGHYLGGWNGIDTQQDGAGAGTSDGMVSVIELSHPLNSGDPDDFALASGDVVGFCIRYFDDDVATSATHHPEECELAENDQMLYGDIMIAEVSTGVVVDIKPGDDVSPINLKSQGVIPVAIMGSADFDVNDIDRTTLRFGPGGATPDHKDLGHLADLDGDGIDDLMTHYRTQDAGLSVGDTEACVTGATLGGVSFEGCDAIRVKD